MATVFQDLFISMHSWKRKNFITAALKTFNLFYFVFIFNFYFLFHL
jgi:hypothetical protein